MFSCLGLLPPWGTYTVRQTLMIKDMELEKLRSPLESHSGRVPEYLT